MESLLHFVWEFRLCGSTLRCAGSGAKINVLDPGRHNSGPGPDFFNAKIKIEGHPTWVGNVEIHDRASDWERHGHDKDEAYNSVILHVVGRDDMVVRRSDGQVIPQAIVVCDSDLARHYTSLISTKGGGAPACARHIPSIPSIHINSWIDALGFERLYEKSDRLVALVDSLAGDWEQAVYVTLARALGFNTNSEPMMRLAQVTPLRLLRKHSDSLEVLEAILLGQACLLDSDDALPDGDYQTLLKREYAFYRAKFGLSQLQSPGWRISSSRPANSPYRRIALLAAMIHRGKSLVSDILGAVDDTGKLHDTFKPALSRYWDNHYTLSAGSTSALPSLGVQSIHSLIINVVVPLMIAYGNAHGDRTATERAIGLLEGIPAEQNRLVRTFTNAGVRCRDAFSSQALIHLHKAYCDTRRCLNCRIGHRILSSRAVISSTSVSPLR